LDNSGNAILCPSRDAVNRDAACTDAWANGSDQADGIRLDALARR
jgi:hypothetical protein